MQYKLQITGNTAEKGELTEGGELTGYFLNKIDSMGEWNTNCSYILF
jgi:hypothetical protein